MHDGAAIDPLPNGPALGAWERHVDLDAKLNKLGGLRRGPIRAVGGLHYVEYSHVYASRPASQRCVQSRTCR
jgi:hypothetical protein